MKILVAEDDFVSRKVLHKMLHRFGECDFATDGKEALKAFELSHRENSPYDLICLDINMPKASGLEVLTEVRKFEEERGVGAAAGVKVIMTTAHDDSENVFGAFKAGCEAYVVKPFDRTKLLARLAEFGFSAPAES